jgi:hypothetical protein
VVLHPYMPQTGYAYVINSIPELFTRAKDQNVIFSLEPVPRQGTLPQAALPYSCSKRELAEVYVLSPSLKL